MIENNIEELLHIYDQTIYTDTDFAMNSVLPKGGFEKKLLVLVNSKDMNPENEMLLGKMLGACGFAENDYYIVLSQANNVISLATHFQPETVLLFDLPLQSEAFNSFKEKNKPFRFGGIKWLICDSLTAVAASPALKSTLWTSGLKILFNIN